MAVISRAFKINSVICLLLSLVVAAALFMINSSKPERGNGAPLATNCSVSAVLVPNCGLWWGSALAAGSGSLVQAVTTQQRATGRRLDIVHTYHRWYDQFPTASERRLSQDGHLLLINWEPTDRAGRAMSWQAIADGGHDEQIRALGTALATLGRPALLSFSHEPELNFNAHGGSASAYVAAYRRVHRLIAEAGASRVRWVWDLMGLADPVWRARYRVLYPGDGYVDWIGWDPYNWAGCRHRGWLSFSQIVTPFYQWLQANGFGGKPFMLAEFGSVEQAGAPAGKANWFAGVPAALTKLANLKAIVYFDLPAPPANCDWLVASSARSIAGFRALARSSAARASAVLDPAG